MIREKREREKVSYRNRDNQKERKKKGILAQIVFALAAL